MRLINAHVAHGLDGLLGGACRLRIELAQVPGKLEDLVLELFCRHRPVDEAHARRGGRVKTLSGQRVIQAVAIVHRYAEHLADQAARDDAPIDLGEPETGGVGRDRKIAGDELGERPAEAVAVDHGDGRFWKVVEPMPAPLMRGPLGLDAPGRVAVEPAKIQLQIHASGPCLAGAGQDQNAGVGVCLESENAIQHLLVERRAHRIALFRAVERDGGDAVCILDENILVVLAVRHGTSEGCVDRAGARMRRRYGAFKPAPLSRCRSQSAGPVG